MSELMREEFEAACIACGLSLRPDGRVAGSYLKEIQCAWMLWQASRAAVCVELPLPVKRAFHEYDLGYNEALDHCKEAIRAAGVKTK